MSVIKTIIYLLSKCLRVEKVMLIAKRKRRLQKIVGRLSWDTWPRR